MDSANVSIAENYEIKVCDWTGFDTAPNYLLEVVGCKPQGDQSRSFDISQMTKHGTLCSR